MKKLNKNGKTVENTVVAYACACDCAWSSSWCRCNESQGTSRVYDIENVNETLKHNTFIPARDKAR